MIKMNEEDNPGISLSFEEKNVHLLVAWASDLSAKKSE